MRYASMQGASIKIIVIGETVMVGEATVVKPYVNGLQRRHGCHRRIDDAPGKEEIDILSSLWIKGKGFPAEEFIQEICRKCDYSRYEVKNRLIVYFSV